MTRKDHGALLSVLTQLMAEAESRALTRPDDPALLDKCHPVRLSAVAETDPKVTRYVLAADAAGTLVDPLLRARTATVGIMKAIWDAGGLHRLALAQATDARVDNEYGSGSAGPLFAYLRYSTCGGQLFTIEDDLVQLLKATDIDEDIPVENLRLPYKDMYIELGRDRLRTGMYLTHPETGKHPFEGAYFAETVADGEPALEITLTGSPAGASGSALDDMSVSIVMAGAGGKSLARAVEDAFAESVRDPEDAQCNGVQPGNASASERTASALQMILLAVKALLFITLPMAELVRTCDGTTARKKVAGSSSSRHLMRAAKRRAAAAYDTIIVRARARREETSQGEAATEVGHEARCSPGAHWRRGHIRSQRCGPGREHTRLVWIRPVLVNAYDIGDKAAERRRYVVRREQGDAQQVDAGDAGDGSG